MLRGTEIAFSTLDAGRDLSLTATDGGLSVAGFGQGGALAAGRDVLIDVSIDLIGGDFEAVRDLTLVGASVEIDSALGGRDVTVTGRTGGVSVGEAHAGDDVRLSGTTIDLQLASSTGLGGDSEGDGSNIVVGGTDVVLGISDAADDVLVNATGTVGAGAATAGRDIVIAGTAIDFSDLIAGRDLLLTATDGGLTVSGLGAGAALSAGRDLSLDVSIDLVAGSLEAVRDLTLTGASMFADSAIAGRDVTVTARTGPLAITNVAAGNDVRLAGTTIDIDNVTAAYDVNLEAVGGNIVATGGDITLGRVFAADDLIVTGTGLVSVGNHPIGTLLRIDQAPQYYVTAGNDIALTGASVIAGQLTAGRDIRLTANGGAPDGTIDSFDTISAVRNVIVDARTANFRGSIDAGNDVAVTTTGPLYLAAVTAGRDVVLAGSLLAVSTLDAGRDLSLTATASSFTATDELTAVRDLSVDAVGVSLATATAGRDLTINSNGGSLDLANGTAGDDVRLGGATLALGQVAATGLGGDSEGDGSNIVATGGAIAAAQLAAATDIAVTGTGAVSIDQANAGQDIFVGGATVGGALQLSGRDISVTTGGSFDATAGLVASRDLSLTAGTTLTFTELSAARDLFLSAAVVSGGDASATRDLTVNATTSIAGGTFAAGRDLVIDPNQTIVLAAATAGGNASIVGASIVIGTVAVGGTTYAEATGGGLAIDTLTSGGDATLIATGKVDLGDATAPALRIVGGDLDVRRSLVTSTLAVETPGQMILGGTAAQGETGFRLAAADIARLRVSGIANFYAGVTTAGNQGLQTPGGNLVLQDFAYDPANLPRIALFADRNHVVDIQGHVGPTTGGGAIQIGDANFDGRFRPGSVYISGSLGSAELVANCYGKIVAIGSLSIYSVNDVIFGASDFRSAVQGTAAGSIDIAAGTPGVAGPADDRLFLVSTRFTVDAGGKVVSQNTSSAPGGFVGVLLAGFGATGPIVDVGLSRVVDLSGSVVDSTGQLRSGFTAASAGELGPGGVGIATFRFNGCLVGGGDCAGAGQGSEPGDALRVEDYQPPRPIDITDNPLTTVLFVEQQPSDLDVLTIGTDDNAIIIRKKTPGQ